MNIKLIIRAMEIFPNCTCVRFRPATRSDTNWVEISNSGTNCSSEVGMGNNGQVLHLNATECMESRKINKELMHVLGFRETELTVSCAYNSISKTIAKALLLSNRI